MKPGTLESLAKKEQFAYLTTIGRKSGKAHTVELWFAYADGRIYLSHEGDYTDWMRNIVENRLARVRIGTLNLETEAAIVKEGSSREAGKRSLHEKYYGPAPKATLDDWFDLSTIIELIPMKDKTLV
jgi:deazaflavin-dependent oxidoreductase (nitroreductase family)